MNTSLHNTTRVPPHMSTHAESYAVFLFFRKVMPALQPTFCHNINSVTSNLTTFESCVTGPLIAFITSVRLEFII